MFGTGQSMRDYYELLGVSPLASKREIARAYRRRAVSHHRNRVIELEDQLELMREAFATLADPAKRREYDRRRDAALLPAAQDEEARLRREGKKRVEIAREIGRISHEIGKQAVASHAEEMRAIADEHDRLEAREARARRRRELLRFAVGLLVACALTAAAWLLYAR